MLGGVKIGSGVSVTADGTISVAAGAVTSVFGRAGAVVAQSGDYTAAQVGAVPITRQIINGTGITGGGALSSDLTLGVVNDTTTQRIRMLDAGTLVGTRQAINFVDGANITVTAADDSGNNRVNVTVAATGLVPTSRQIINGTGITGGGDLSADRTLSVVADTTTQRLRISKAGTLTGTRQEINFIDGSNISITTADNSPNNRVNVTIATTGLVPTTRQIINGTGITGGGDLSADRTLSVVADTTVQKGRVSNAGTLVGTRQEINFIQGSNVTLTVTDNSANNRVDVTIAASAGGSQTPWTSNIDAANFALNSTSGIGVGTASNTANYGILISSLGTHTAGLAIAQTTASARAAILMQNNLGNSFGMGIGGSTEASLPNVGYIASAVDFVIATGTPQTVGVYFSSGKMRVGGATAPTYTVDAVGDVNCTGVYRINGVPLAASNITNAVDTTQTYANPAWISSLAWSKITGAPATGVSSVFGRSGAVVAASGDYSAAQVTNAVDQTATYANPSWITSLAWSKITGAPSVSSYQTPWLSDIDGASHMLSSASAIGIGIAANTAWLLWIRQNSGFSTGQALMENIHADGAAGFNVSNNGSSIGGFMLCGSNYPNSAWRNTLVLYTQSAQPIAFGTNNSEKMRLSPAGNLGVATTSPQARIDSVGMIRVTDTNPVPTSGVGLEMFYDTTTPKGFIGAYDRGASAYKRLEINGGPLTLQMNGQGVGIGTANPGATLHVVRGTDNIDAMLVSGAESNKYISFQCGPSQGTMFHWNGSGYGGLLLLGRVGVGAVHSTYPFQVSGGRSRFDSSEQYAVGIAQSGQGAFWLGATASANPTLIFFNTSGVERMRIQDNGNVGISNGTPYSALSIMNPGGNPGSAAAANQITICEGTNNPDYRLALGYFFDGTYKGSIQALAGGPGGGYLLLQPQGGICAIGTTTPANRPLQVTGYANASSSTFAGGVGLVRIEGTGAWSEPMLEFHEQGNAAPIACVAAKNTGGGAGDLIFLTRTSGAGTATARMAVQSNGGVKIGMNGNPYSAGDLSLCRDSAPTSGVLYFGNGTSKYIYYDGANFQFNGGSLYVNGTLVSTSDSRIKQNVRDLAGGLPFIERLRPREFEFNGFAGTEAGKRGVSLVAQELQKVSPVSVETFRGAEGTDLLAFSPTEILMHAVLAIQQLQARLQALEAR